MWRGKLFLLGFILFFGFTLQLAIAAAGELHATRRADINNAHAHELADAIQAGVLGASLEARLAPKPMRSVYRPAQKPLALTPASEAHIVYRVPTTEPVIFITIDDGLIPNENALQLMRKNGIVASLFLNDTAIANHYDYFKRWQKTGSRIQNHTVHHPHLPYLTFEQQKAELCDDSTRFADVFAQKPTLFRPPYGEFNNDTTRAVTDCDMRALVWWSVVVDNGALAYQGVDHLQPGDIVLLHFTPHLDQDLTALLAQAEAQQLQIGQLEDWLF